jgi:serralysin
MPASRKADAAPILDPGDGIIRACVPRPFIPPPAAFSREEMAAQTSVLWRPGTTLRILFGGTSRRVGGSPADRRAVMRAAAIISQYANIHFHEVKSNPSDIRCSFDRTLGSWSYLGRQNLSIPSGEATCNMGWPGDPGRDIHELCHALGCVHEHQWGEIPWNREACYEFYGAPPNNWSRQEVDEQVLNRINSKTLTTSQWDKTSIMCYPIPAQLVTDPKFVVGWNQTLSPTDIAMLKKLYPPS